VLEDVHHYEAVQPTPLPFSSTRFSYQHSVNEKHAHVEAAFDTSLVALGFEYVDLYLMH
jgi:aryl-alcohol dehydrogenase-like predicted oxidoreductase